MVNHGKGENNLSSFVLIPRHTSVCTMFILIIPKKILSHFISKILKYVYIYHNLERLNDIKRT